MSSAFLSIYIQALRGNGANLKRLSVFPEASKKSLGYTESHWHCWLQWYHKMKLNFFLFFLLSDYSSHGKPEQLQMILKPIYLFHVRIITVWINWEPQFVHWLSCLQVLTFICFHICHNTTHRVDISAWIEEIHISYQYPCGALV